MAVHRENETFTTWTHHEPGNPITRRIHRMEVQDRHGRVHILTGDRLPDLVTTSVGPGMKGCHLAQILLSPNAAPEWTPDKPNTWGLSHFFCFGGGLIVLVLVRFIHGLFIECF